MKGTMGDHEQMGSGTNSSNEMVKYTVKGGMRIWNGKYTGLEQNINGQWIILKGE